MTHIDDDRRILPLSSGSLGGSHGTLLPSLPMPFRSRQFFSTPFLQFGFLGMFFSAGFQYPFDDFQFCVVGTTTFLQIWFLGLFISAEFQYPFGDLLFCFVGIS